MNACPKCGSTSTYHRSTLKQDFRCRKCGNEWESVLPEGKLGDIFDRFFKDDKARDPLVGQIMDERAKRKKKFRIAGDQGTDNLFAFIRKAEDRVKEIEKQAKEGLKRFKEEYDKDD